jgi:hypothetical protein
LGSHGVVASGREGAASSGWQGTNAGGGRGATHRFSNTADDIANSFVLPTFARAHDMLVLKEICLANNEKNVTNTEEPKVGDEPLVPGPRSLFQAIESTAEDKHHQDELGQRSRELAGSTWSLPDDDVGQHSSHQAGGSARIAKQQG